MLSSRLIPEFTATTGIPAATALCTAGAMTAGSASVTAIPATFPLTADRTRLAWAAASGSWEYCRSRSSLAAAASAPRRTRSQNVSPGAWWVISATVARGAPPLCALDVVVVAPRSPPEHAATAIISTERMYAKDIRAIDPPLPRKPSRPHRAAGVTPQ